MNADPADIEHVWTLLRRDVPEVTSGMVRVMGMVRERGRRTNVAVASTHSRVDPIGTVVGIMGVHLAAAAGQPGQHRPRQRDCHSCGLEIYCSAWPPANSTDGFGKS